MDAKPKTFKLLIEKSLPPDIQEGLEKAGHEVDLFEPETLHGMEPSMRARLMEQGWIAVAAYSREGDGRHWPDKVLLSLGKGAQKLPCIVFVYPNAYGDSYAVRRLLRILSTKSYLFEYGAWVYIERFTVFLAPSLPASLDKHLREEGIDTRPFEESCWGEALGCDGVILTADEAQYRELGARPEPRPAVVMVTPEVMRRERGLFDRIDALIEEKDSMRKNAKIWMLGA